MKAHVKKDEGKSFFGSIRYIVVASIELNSRELMAVKKHDLGRVWIIDDEFVGSLPGDSLDQRKVMRRARRVEDFLYENKIKFKRLVDASNFEASFYEGCQGLKRLIDSHLEDDEELGEVRTVEF